MANISEHIGFRLKFNWGLLFIIALNLLLYLLIAAGINQKLFSLPSSFGALLSSPWTLFTYMFAQTAASHLIFNMIALCASAIIISRILRSLQLIKLYLSGGLMGALFFMFYYAVIPDTFSENAFLDGSSAAIYAFLAFLALAEPALRHSANNHSLVFFRWFVGALIVLNLFGLTGENYAANLSHLGGAFGGVLFFILHRLAASVFPRKAFTGTNEIDRILAKVRKSGYSSLDADEREKLIRKSK